MSREGEARHQSVLDGVIGQVKQVLENMPTHHGLPHIERVVSNCKMLAQTEPLSSKDTFLLEAAAWLHDLGRAYENPEMWQNQQEGDHAKFSAIAAGQTLKFLDWIERDIAEITEAITQHSDREPASTLIGQFLQDADKLDGFGRIGLKRVIAHRTNLDSELVLEALKSGSCPEGMREELPKLIEQIKYMEEWYSMLNTASAREIGLSGCAELVGYRILLEQLLARA